MKTSLKFSDGWDGYQADLIKLPRSTLIQGRDKTMKDKDLILKLLVDKFGHC